MPQKRDTETALHPGEAVFIVQHPPPPNHENGSTENEYLAVPVYREKAYMLYGERVHRGE